MLRAQVIRVPASLISIATAAARRPRRMSWTCHGRSNTEMVDALRAARLFGDDAAARAMKSVDRGLFCPDPQYAYVDAPQTIGYNATISAPHMHATCLELLKEQLKPGKKALDVGSGSGYLTAVFGHMIGPQGKAIGIEHIPELAERAEQTARSIPFAREMLQEGSLRYFSGDGMQGWREDAPYDAIHVGASAAQIPQPLLEQLAPDGRLVLPVGGVGERQNLAVIDRDKDGNFQRQDMMGVQYVPLTSREEQLGKMARPVSAW